MLFVRPHWRSTGNSRSRNISFLEKAIRKLGSLREEAKNDKDFNRVSSDPRFVQLISEIHQDTNKHDNMLDAA